MSNGRKNKSVCRHFIKQTKKKVPKRQNRFRESLSSSNKILQQLMNNKTPVLNEKQLSEKLLEGQKIASFEPLNLHKELYIAF